MTATPADPAALPPQQNGRCARCYRTGPVFAAPADWGKVPSPLCVRHWSKVADARARRTYTDAHDAYDNAPDEVWERHLAGDA